MDTKLVNAAVKIKLTLDKVNKKYASKVFELQSAIRRITAKMSQSEYNEYCKRTT